MTETTAHLHIRPDYYPSIEECAKAKYDRKRSNPRYKGFCQAHFTAGDEEQFQMWRDRQNGNLCPDPIDLTSNLFAETTVLHPWQGNSDITAQYVDSTFRYIFHKFKKGIYVRIRDNRLTTFLPFSNANFRNEWSHLIAFDPTKYTNFEDMIRKISTTEGHSPERCKINKFTDAWYANNCLLRNEFPVNEGDSAVAHVRDMLLELCDHRQIPDIELFINRRDFPIMKRDWTEPYHHIFNSDKYPLISHVHHKYTPVLSSCNTDDFADILLPTWEDWSRVSAAENRYFDHVAKTYPNFDTPWDDKKPTAVFRGSTTGAGVTIDTNMRLKAAYLSHTTAPEDGVPLLDAGISKWNLRPRKLCEEKYLQTIDITSLPFGLAKFFSTEEQSTYKYILNIDGHVTAYRLSLELSMRSVILLVKSPYKIWYSHLLEPYVHYVPVAEDLSDLLDQIRWCREHDDECRQIAINAFEFHNKYLQKKGMFDYLQKLFIDLKKHTGHYLYNTTTPEQIITKWEEKYTTIHNFPSVPTAKLNLPDGNDRKNFPAIQQYFISHQTNPEFPVDNIWKSEKTTVEFGKIGNIPVVRKKTTSSLLHELFIGQCLNTALLDIPSFPYTFGQFGTDELLSERVGTMTFENYLKSEHFSFDEYIGILAELCMILQYAQEKFGFVHNDMYPWNITLGQRDGTVEFPLLDGVYISYSVQQPHLIDFGRSRLYYDCRHFGSSDICPIHDILTMLFSSLFTIVANRHIAHEDVDIALWLGNYITGTTYRPDKFTTMRELRHFLFSAHKFSNLLYTPKNDIYTRTPLHFLRYLSEKFTLHESVEFSEVRKSSREIIGEGVYKNSWLVEQYNHVLTGIPVNPEYKFEDLPFTRLYRFETVADGLLQDPKKILEIFFYTGSRKIVDVSGARDMVQYLLQTEQCECRDVLRKHYGWLLEEQPIWAVNLHTLVRKVIEVYAQNLREVRGKDWKNSPYRKFISLYAQCILQAKKFFLHSI